MQDPQNTDPYSILLNTGIPKKISVPVSGQESKYKAVIDNSMQAFFLMVPYHSILESNRAACELFGYTDEEFRQIGPQSIIDHGDPLILQTLREKKLSGQSSGHLTGIKKNGERFPCEFSSVDFTDNNGREMTSIMLTDISESSKAAREMSLLINNTEESFILLDRNLKIITYNSQFEKLYSKYLGQTVTKGHSILDYAIQGTADKLRRIYDNVLLGFEEESEIAIPVAGSPEKIFIIKYKPAKDEEDNIIGAFVSVIDISEKKRAAQQLVINEKRYRALVETGADSVVILTTEGKPVYASPTMERVLGYTEAETLEIDLFSMFHPGDIAWATKVWEEVMTSPGVPIAVNPSRMKHKDGSWRWLEGTLTNLLHDPAINGIVDNFRDVTDKVNAANEITARQKQLEQAEANYREIFENASDGIFIHELNSCRIIDVNQKASEILGRSKEEIMHADPASFTVAAPNVSLWSAMKKIRLAAAEGPQSFEMISRHRDGTLNWIEVSLKKANIAGTDRILAFFRLINDRKKAEAQKEFERRDKEALINTTNNLIWSVSSDFKLVAANKAFINSLQKFSNIILKPGDELLMKDRFDSWFIEFWERLYKKALIGEAFTEEVYFPAGDTVPESWAEISFNPIYDKNAITGIACYSRDITERKKAEKIIERANAEKNTILESIGDGFFAIDKDWIITYWNHQAEKMLGRLAARVVGCTLWEIFPDIVGSKFHKEFEYATESGIAVHFENYYNPLGKWYEVSAYPSDNGLSIYFKDVSERILSDLRLIELNKNLQKQTKDLATSNTELERFAYVASHDLQEPLRMVSSFMQLLQKKYKDQIDDTANKYIHYAVDGADRMKKLIMDLLEYSRVNTGIELIGNSDMNEVMEEVIANLDSEINLLDANIEITCLPVLINTHKTQMVQLMQNLVSNALKYHSDKKPDIKIYAKEEELEWIFCVEDNGIGIESRFLDKVFIIFQRLHNKSEYSGTGIGLSICKKIVERHEGRIWVESVPGEGSTFYFSISKKTIV